MGQGQPGMSASNDADGSVLGLINVWSVPSVKHLQFH